MCHVSGVISQVSFFFFGGGGGEQRGGGGKGGGEGGREGRKETANTQERLRLEAAPDFGGASRRAYERLVK